MTRELDVYLYKKFIGKLKQTEHGRLEFNYDPNYLKLNTAKPLSVAMPLSIQTYDDSIARSFFSGLLPENLIRHRLARYLGVSEKNPFALLKAVGGECAGAVSLYPKDKKLSTKEKSKFEILNNDQLKEIF